MPTQRDVERLQALREADRRGMLGPVQKSALSEIERRFMQFAEPAMTAASAAIAEPVSGFVGLAALPYGSDVASQAIERTQQAMTYQPRTEGGLQGLQALQNVMAPVGEAFEGASSYLGDAAYEATGSPALGAAAYSVPTAALELLGANIARRIPGRKLGFGDIGKRPMAGGQRGAVGGVVSKAEDAKDLMKRWQERGIKSFVREKPDALVLDKIVVPDEMRGSGVGSQAMQELVDYADETGKRIELSPTADFGGNKKRLTEFYRRFGFTENKGKAKDFEVSESMYRPARDGGVTSKADDVQAFKKTTGDPDVDAKIKSVEMMTPDEYLQKAYEATDQRVGGSFESWMASNQRTPEDVKRYTEAMEAGGQFDMPWVDFDAGSQDGRNRALAAKAAGIKEIPVGVVPQKTLAQRLAQIKEELKTAKGYRRFKLEEELKRLNDEL